MIKRFGLAVLLTFVFAASIPGQHTILVINSYHHGYSWSDSIIAGIESVLNGPSLRLRHEYMDMKHFDSLEYRLMLRDLYDQKYRDRQPTVIIGTDIVALQFLSAFHDELFPEVPTVFAAVHDFRAELPDGDWWTGTYGELPVIPTLELMLSLQPELRRVLVVAENTAIGRTFEAQTRRAAAEFGAPVEVATLSDNDVDRLLEAIAATPAAGAVLYTLVSHDAGNRFVPPEESVGRLVREGHTPVYGMLEIYSSMGIVGGALLDGHDLGARVAMQVLAILEGTVPSAIAVETIEDHRAICDAAQLARFGIPRDRVPKGVELINLPERTVQLPRRTLVLAAVTIALLILVITALGSLVHRQHRTQRLLEREKARCRRAYEVESLAAEMATYLNQLEGPERVSPGRITGYLRRAAGIDTVRICTDSTGTDELIDALLATGRDAGIVVEDVAALEDRAVAALAESRGISSFVLSSLAVNQERLGSVLYSRSRPGAWTEEDLALLSTVSDMLAATWFRFGATAAQARAERRTAEARAMLERTARMASIGVVAAGITHEIAQPLNYIKMTTDSLRYPGSASSDADGSVAVPARKLARIAEALNRIERVVTHMRRYWSAPSNGGVQPNGSVQHVDVKEGVANAAALLRQQLIDHQVRLEFDITESSVFVRAALVDLEQVIVNLVGNAIQALDDAGTPSKRVMIRVHHEDEIVILIVEDNGPGIDPADLGVLFDPFFSSRAPDEGMGLGLAIVESIVQRAGGRIEAGNRADGGAMFIVRLPRVRSEVLS